VPEALLHGEPHGLRLAGVNVDNPIRREADRGQRRRVDVGLLRLPPHLARRPATIKTAAPPCSTWQPMPATS